MLTWTGHGRLYPSADAGRTDPGAGFAALPFAMPLGERRYRVFHSRRDAAQRSHIHACTLDAAALRVVPGSGTGEPLLAPGALGAFDDCGCTMSCVVETPGRIWLYYTGWTLGQSVPFHWAIGLATSDDGGRSFTRHSAAPLLGRHRVDPFACASPFVLVEDGRWRMWYLSMVAWEGGDGSPLRHRYLIKYAESRDGLRWRRDGRVCIGFRDDGEYAFGRPCVIRTRTGYAMWYCSRGDRYRLGYAESDDGLAWRRKAPLIEPPPSVGFDDAMQAYPMVVRDDDRLLMLYNGNGYGATGFGCATSPLDDRKLDPRATDPRPE